MVVQRYGRRLRKGQPRILNRAERQNVDAALNRPNALLSDGTGRSRPESIRRQLEVLSIVKRSGYLQLSPAQILAEIAGNRGLTEGALGPYLGPIETLRTRGVFKAGGRANLLYSSIAGNKLHDIHRVMEAHSERPLNTHQVAERIGLSEQIQARGARSREASAIVSRGMAILEQMEHVDKYPEDSAVPGGPYTWLSRRYRHTAQTVPEWNKTWLALKKLAEGPQFVSSIMKKGWNTQERTGGFVDPTANLSNLVASGLASIHKVKRNNRTFIQYRIRPRGLWLVRQQAKSSVLNEELRRGLLGMPPEGLSPHQERRYGDIKDWINIAMVVEKEGTSGRGGRLNIRKITKELGVSPTQVTRVRGDMRNPIRGMKARTALRYLGIMEHEDPKKAKWFEQHLVARGLLPAAG